MPGTSILDILLNLEGAYWPPGVADKFGQSSYGTVVQIRCKEQSTSGQGISSQGKTYNKTGSVYTDTEVVAGGYIWVGTFSAVPATPPNKQIIQSVSKTKDPDNTETVYVASY